MLTFCCYRRLALVIVILATSACPHPSDEMAIRELRYPNSQQRETHEDKNDKTFTISFETRLRYPSDDVLRFYDRELQRLGWSPVADQAGKKIYRTWMCFPDATKPGVPDVHQFVAAWANRDKQRMVLLAIRYFSNEQRGARRVCDEPNNDVQHVDVQIMPFVLLPS